MGSEISEGPSNTSGIVLRSQRGLLRSQGVCFRFQRDLGDLREDSEISVGHSEISEWPYEYSWGS